MSEDEFTKLFKYSNDRFKGIEKHFETVHEDNSKTLNAVDANAKNLRLSCKNC